MFQRCRPFTEIFFICFACFWNFTHFACGVHDRDIYTGCFPEKIDLYVVPVIVGNVETCLAMCESSYFRYAVLSKDKCSCSNVLYGTRLEEICTIRCSRNKSQICGGVEAQSYYDTGVRAAGPAHNLQVTNYTNTTIALKWESPQMPDELSNYILNARVVRAFTVNMPQNIFEWIIQPNDRQYEMVNLYPGADYSITLFSYCGSNKCGDISIMGKTQIGDPFPLPKEPKVIKRFETTLVVQINPAVNDNGPVSYYRIIVMLLDSSIVQPFDDKLLSDYYQSQSDGIPYYITAELDFQNHTQLFTVGDNSTLRGYYNSPLPPDAHVHISLGVVSIYDGVTKYRYAIGTHAQHVDEKYVNINTENDMEDDDVMVIPLTVACIIFGILLVGSVFAYSYLRYKTTNRRQRLSDNHELTLHGPIVEMDNNSFISDDYTKGHFNRHLNGIIENLNTSQRFPRNAIRLNTDNVIAQGQFGDVFTGKLYADTQQYDCQFHVISDDMEPQIKAQFLQELQDLIRITPNENFLSFFGISSSPDWFYIIIEKLSVCLKKKLIESRVSTHTPREKFSSLSEECILQWIFDIAVAMEYLECNKIVHKKLCSYNVYINEMNQIKVALFGPTPLTDEGKVVDISRWMAPEVLRFQKHTTKSDVWSFGCLAWECCCLGATLYANITSQDLLPRIKNYGWPEQPAFIYNDLYQLFLNCWQLEPSERPDFEEIAFNVRQILTSPNHALSFNHRENLSIPYYLPLLEIHN